MIIVERRQGVKIRFDGPDSKGKVTSKTLLVADANVDEVKELVRRAIEENGQKKERKP